MKTNPANQKPWIDCPPSGRLLRPQEVFDRMGLSKSLVYAMIAEGTFPPFLKVSARAAAMPEAWLESFVESRAEHALTQTN
ncbi:helix-turn-helix transcriptional regulator [Silicimonas sp. MF1-12-2]|uniref:helix-turn-helix transcriptional regulator n=1 Tax=Silicimonas sp. MF1-12-2 TaxID=3384793 RepID=UPI0039B45CD4